eukprot:CFRG5892T1
MNHDHVKPLHMVTKRRNPFGDDFNRMSKTTYVDPNAIHETRMRTHRLLMGANTNQKPVNPSIALAAPSLHKCWVCTVMSDCTACAFCEKDVCETCQRQCEGCLESFCSLCSTTNYDEKYDRMFCLDCNEEERRSSPKFSQSIGLSRFNTFEYFNPQLQYSQ